MIQLRLGDVIAFKSDDKYYYAIIITKIILFGGNLIYTFHLKTNKLLSMEEVIGSKNNGFTAIVDFIFAKKEDRIVKVGHISDYERYWEKRFFKQSNDVWKLILKKKELPKIWYIYDEKGNEVKKVKRLMQEEIQYPLHIRIDDKKLSELINIDWQPTQLAY